MRIARLSLRSSVRPRVALERDGSYYDVEALEEALGTTVDVPGDRSDFHTRVVALGCAGLGALDGRLLRGERPRAARIVERFAPLAPFETDRATFFRVGTQAGGRALSVGLARAVAGQDDLVAIARGEQPPDFRVGVAVLLGDDLSHASLAEAKHAIVGYAILIDWFSVATSPAFPLGTAQVGPWLVPASALGRVAALEVATSGVGGRVVLGKVGDLGAIEEAVAFASGEAELRAGDLVGVGSLASPRPEAVVMHAQLEVTIERIGTLRGTPVPRR